MVVRVSKRGVAGLDVSNMSSGANPPPTSGNTYTFSSSYNEVGLVPYAYVHWGNGSAGNSTINRRWNVSSITETNTGRWTVNFDTDWDLYTGDFQKVVPFVNAQRYNSGTSVTSIIHCSVADTNSIGRSSFTIRMREVGTTVAYRNPAYAWIVAMGPGVLDNVTSSSAFKINGTKMTKVYTPNGNKTMQPSAYVKVNSGSIPSSGGLSIGGYYPAISSFTRIAVGRYTWGINVGSVNGSNVDGDGGNHPMIFAMGDRPGTTTPAKVSIPSNVTYSVPSTTFRNHNTANTQLDFNAHIVMF